MSPNPTTYALVRPFGSNVLVVTAHPRDTIDSVAAALTAAGYGAEPIAHDGAGLARAVMIWREQDFAPSELAVYVDALAEAGIGAFGYELFHDHEFADFDAWARVGRVPAPAPDAPVFLLSYPHDEWSSADVVLLGDTAALDRLLPHVAAEAESCDAAQGPTGTCSLVLHYEGDDAYERVHGIVEIAKRLGVPLHHPFLVDLLQL